jgi:hypothetical protein
MDPISILGIVKGVTGLVPICIEGFELINKFFKAKRDVKTAMTNIYIQQGSFIAWSRMWDFRKGDVHLEQFVNTWPDVGERVLVVLGVLSDTFANVKELQNKYGIHAIKAPKVQP